MSNPNKILSIVFAIIAWGLSAQNNLADEVLSYKDYRELIENNVPNFILEEQKEASAALEIDKSELAGDYNLTASGSAAFSDGVLLNNNQLLDSTSLTLAADLGLQKKFLRSGTTLSASLGLSDLIPLEDPTLRGNTLFPSVKLGISQSLLYDFFGSISKLSIATAERNYEIAKIERKIQERNLYKYYDILYVRWLWLLEYRRLLSLQIVRSQENYNNARERNRLNVLEADNLQRVYSSLLNYRGTLININNQIANLKAEFAAYLGTDKNYIPQQSLFESMYAKTQVELDSIAFSETYAWLKINETLDSLRLSMQVNKKNKLPNLILNVDGSLARVPSVINSNTRDYSLAETLQAKFSIGLVLTLPLGFRQARYTIDALQMQIDQLASQIEIARHNFLKSNKILRESRYTKMQDISNKEELVATSAALYNSLRVKYRQARASASDLLEVEIMSLTNNLALLNSKRDMILDQLEYIYTKKDTHSSEYFVEAK